MNAVKLRSTLGRVVRAHRAFLGLSQEGFADKVGIHRTYMGAVERGERNLTLLNLVRIANALGIRLSDLIAEAEKAMKPDPARK
jgi:transcriptional regulator with XRE-family HTH domain